MPASELLLRLANAIAGEINPTEKTFTQDEFTSYANEQILALTKDTPEVAKSRLSSLQEALKVATALEKESSVKISVFVPPEAAAGADAGADAAGAEGAEKNKGESIDDRVSAAKSALQTATANLEDVLAEREAAKAGGKAPPFGGKPGGAAASGDDEDEDEDEDDDAEKNQPPVEKGFEVIRTTKGMDPFHSDMSKTKIDEYGRMLRPINRWGNGNSLHQ